MGKFFKTLTLSLLTFGLIVTQNPVLGTVKAKANPLGIEDLVIDLNVPQVKKEVKDKKIDLHALHVYEDGHFLLASEDIAWKSSNKNVATVDDDGEVTLTGHNGKTFISVTDGRKRDRISIQFKGNHTEKVLIRKEEGNRYDLIGNAIKHMSLEEKVGQMLMPDFRTWKGQNVTEMKPEIEQLVKDFHLGGVILFRENVVTTEQTTRLADAYQEASEKYGLLTAIDQEGGVITRLQSGTDMPGNMALGATRSEELAEKVGTSIGEELNALGINMNLAPVLDVNNNPDNPVIGVRSFGEDPELVAKLGKAYMRGLQESGTAATAKHFPGHGDTAVDSHLGLPEVPYDLDRLKKIELYPFQQAMDAGVDAVMTAHVTFPKIDDGKAISKKDGSEISIPATLSHKVLTGLMRENMGFQGVIITDAMNMQAISDHFGPVDAAIRAVKAGTDIVLMPVGLKEVAEGLYHAVKTGDISVERIEKSNERILALKLNRGIVKPETNTTIDDKVANALQVVGSAEHKQVEKDTAAKSITLVKNNAVLPIKAAKEDKIVVVGDSGLYVRELAVQVQKHHGNVTYIPASKPLTDQQLAQMNDAKYIILGTYSASVAGRSPGSNQMKLANQVIEQADAPVIGVAIRNPYDIMAYPNVDAYLAQYGFRTASFEATANTIFGENNPAGKLPVTIYHPSGSVLYGFGQGLGY
ncbi:glycoside hydrolase family 3 protein [Bacillus sp. V59.32b]|uniref:glycoside hydrolase family 3 protein n=1 Tax=Bacillus sp. V59.32b TaxID=1758642 RepID=UPI000E3DA535|nr:glycoside hydrolase family 3 protein [Bacillus sp. V59.32b]RFU70020.1 beta-N-acetylhexosaminidase [Bacillus sp. V59.32b]